MATLDEAVQRQAVSVAKLLQGCQEVCPCCGSKCDKCGEHSHHMCTNHLLPAFNGWRIAGSKEASLDMCKSKRNHEAAKRAHAELASKQVDEQGSRQSVDEHVQHLQSMEEWWCGSKHKPSPSQVCSVYEVRIAGERPGLIEDTAAHAKELGDMHEVYCALPENAKAPPRPCLVWKSRHGAHSDL